MRRHPPVARGSRRGLALAAVLVVGLGLLLIAAGTLHLVRAEVAAIASGESRVQSRFAARAATRSLMATLARDRAFLLEGGMIETPETIELFEFGTGDTTRLAIARLLPVGPGGALLAAEAGRLDLNLVDADALVATGLLDRLEADTIIAARDARPGGRFSSVLDLLALEGDAAVGPTRVLGPLDDLRILSRVDAEDEGVGERIAARLDADLGSGETALNEVFTVHAFEPDLRRDGTPRILLGTEDPDLDDLDEETARGVRSILEGGTERDGDEDAESGRDDAAEPSSGESPDDASEALPPLDPAEGLGSRVASLSTRPDVDLGSVLDALTEHEGGWRNGLLDINTAPVEALQGIAGIDAELAAAIVARRDTLPEERRFDRFWPVVEGLVDAAAWGGIVDRVTTRCLVWRAVIAVGSVPTDDIEAPLESPIAWEVVVDLGEERPRLVEVRDVTLLEIVARFVGTELDEGRERLDPSVESDPSEVDSMFGDDPLFDEVPMFEDDPLFDEAPMFEDDPLFDDTPLFSDDPAFGTSPLFDDAPGPGSDDSPAGRAPSGRRDRGPGGRWRPATSSR